MNSCDKRSFVCAMVQESDEFEVREANETDISSLTTIIPRSCAPNAPLNQLFPPDSVLVKQWWAEVYRKATELASYHILVTVHGNTVIGVLTLHLWYPEDLKSTSNGLCTLVPLTDGHSESKELEEALYNQASRREQIMQKQPNFMIDLMAVDQDYQNKGIGRRMIEHACRIADSEKAAIFLQTTKAKAFYLNLNIGFVSERGDEESGVVIRPRPQDHLDPDSA